MFTIPAHMRTIVRTIVNRDGCSGHANSRIRTCVTSIIGVAPEGAELRWRLCAKATPPRRLFEVPHILAGLGRRNGLEAKYRRASSLFWALGDAASRPSVCEESMTNSCENDVTIESSQMRPLPVQEIDCVPNKKASRACIRRWPGARTGDAVVNQQMDANVPPWTMFVLALR